MCCNRRWLLDVQAVSTSAEFSASGGFIELPSSLFTHGTDSWETVEMTVVTEQLSGLLLWQGQTPSRSNSKDFIAVAVDNGRVQFRFRLFICWLCVTSVSHAPSPTSVLCHTLLAQRRTWNAHKRTFFDLFFGSYFYWFLECIYTLQIFCDNEMKKMVTYERLPIGW